MFEGLNVAEDAADFAEVTVLEQLPADCLSPSQRRQTTARRQGRRCMRPGKINFLPGRDGLLVDTLSTPSGLPFALGVGE